MLTFKNLTEAQRLQLKEALLVERNEARGLPTYYGELAEADDLISDEELAEAYDGIHFSPDDFF